MKEKIKQYLPGIIIGIILSVVAYLGYFFYKGIKLVQQDHAIVMQDNKALNDLLTAIKNAQVKK